MRDLEFEVRHDLFQDNLGIRIKSNYQTLGFAVVVILLCASLGISLVIRGRYVLGILEIVMAGMNIWTSARLIKSTKRLREIKDEEQRLYELCLEESENEDE